ncbi:hypothetical protein A3C67_01565 [Candidatus Nomurabacteria bacterium RIFCSPHIGHO2_02_FULL_42_19]|uniref:Transcriptional repressor PaaX-like central Cas2-like domain-containing protein n=1 Tax=Candidatus Nomurabacteria bacterium RIFCSPHIGHO2_02_FULL_42_19 TaxID=1801756 RepID=A0A1F6W2G1_9BACT|nr:MAG: hypothetical protein A3C67_01565 [Candidatus Nomurabacteria bacterium RIFCSPHIGHO2_02_FULL_42_19]
MKGEILLKALEILEKGLQTQADFFEAVLTSGYGASMGKIDYEYQKIKKNQERSAFSQEELKKRKRRVQIYISKMKQDGLIREAGKNKKIKLAPKGFEKIEELKNKLPGSRYKTEDQDGLIIISFDIPEKFRRKRDWFREVVKKLGFNIIHQSVWAGEAVVPRELIEDLEDLKILEYVEIFKINKEGTLKKQ